jgi:O-antigen/teichoic acid export membrane protein
MLSGRGRAATSGVIWAGISQAARVLIQIATLAVLSRLLPPVDFGLLAMATVVTVFATLLRDMGTAAAVIQREKVGNELLDTVFWFNVCLGGVLAIVILLIAFPVSTAYGEPRLAGVLATLAVSFPLASTGAVHQALLERSLEFRTLARIEISSCSLALLVATIAALNGMGVYSLVLNAIATVALTSIQLWWVSEWRPTRRWSGTEFRGLWGFSSNLGAFQVLNYFARNADTILIGRFLGATDLGWYNMGYRIMLFPVNSLSGVVSRALFPVLSRQQADNAGFAAIYLKTTSAIFVITAPLMAGLWVLRQPFVEVVLGKSWLPVAEILAWLAPVGMTQSLLTTVGLIYMATGSTRLMMRWGAFASTVVVAALIVGLHWGYLGVVRSYAAVTFLLAYPALAIPLKLIDVGMMDLVRSVLPQLVTAAVMVAVVAFLDRAFLDGAEPVFKLVALIPAGVITYVATGCLLMKTSLLAVAGAMRWQVSE